MPSLLKGTRGIQKMSPLSSSSKMWLFALILLNLCIPAASIADIVAIIPDRSTAYPNGLHNGLLSSAFKYNITLEVRSVGDFDKELSKQVLQEAIDSEEQPKIYCIWPVDVPSRWLMKDLYDRHAVPIIQLNQLPGEDSQWEWNHLLGYAGPSDALRASNAGLMMVDALTSRGVINPKVVALGYPDTYGGYHLSIAAFRRSIAGSPIQISHDLPLDWGNQPAYDALVSLMDELDKTGETIHGVYAMDDNIMIGAYEALNDRGRLEGDDAVTLVGTVCNGHRELLAEGMQFGTTIQSPFLEATLAIDSALEYLRDGKLTETVRFTPNPIATGETWETQRIDFLGEVYLADGLCTWTLDHERRNGLQNVEDAADACLYVDCLFIPNGIVITGYTIAAINFALCAAGFALLYIHRNKKVVQLAQPFFLGLVLLGATVDTTSILFMSRDNRNFGYEELDVSCMAWLWLLTLGQMMTTTTLVAKMARIKRVIQLGGVKSSTHRRRKVSAKRAKVSIRDVSGYILGGLLFDFAVLIIWTIQDPFKWQTTVVSRDYQDTILQARGECSSESDKFWVYPFVILMVHLLVLVYGNLLAWQTRRFHKISDSRMVAVSLFNSIQLLIVAAIMLSLSGDNVSISYVIRACYAFLNNVGVILLIVAPKLYKCVIGQGDILPDMSAEDIRMLNQRDSSRNGGGARLWGSGSNFSLYGRGGTSDGGGSSIGRIDFDSQDMVIEEADEAAENLTGDEDSGDDDTPETVEPVQGGQIEDGISKKIDDDISSAGSKSSNRIEKKQVKKAVNMTGDAPENEQEDTDAAEL